MPYCCESTRWLTLVAWLMLWSAAPACAVFAARPATTTPVASGANTATIVAGAAHLADPVELQSTEQPTEVLVPAGPYWKYYAPGKPPIAVHVDAFSMDVFPVSIADYAACIMAGRCSDAPIYRYIENKNYRYNERTEPSDYPADYAAALSQAASDGRQMAYVTPAEAAAYCAVFGKRLPTAAERAKAARGADNKNAYWWGNAKPDCSKVNHKDCANYSDQARATNLPPAPYGTYNMFGMFNELLLDVYHQRFEHTKYTRNPLCTDKLYHSYPELKESLIYSFRAASGVHNDFHLSIDYGSIITAGADYYDDLGFRCVRSTLMQPDDFNK